MNDCNKCNGANCPQNYYNDFDYSKYIVLYKCLNSNNYGFKRIPQVKYVGFSQLTKNSIKIFTVRFIGNNFDNIKDRDLFFLFLSKKADEDKENFSKFSMDYYYNMFLLEEELEEDLEEYIESYVDKIAKRLESIL